MKKQWRKNLEKQFLAKGSAFPISAGTLLMPQEMLNVAGGYLDSFRRTNSSGGVDFTRACSGSDC
jgi:hypothetical protein